MARLECKCGEVLWNGMAPNKIELIVYTDEEWDRITNSDCINPFDIPKPKNDVWRCPNCERIYVFNEKNEIIKKYILEKD